MIVLKVEKIKDFMARVLTDEMFDKFHVAGCEVTTFVTFQTDGRRCDDWFDMDEKPMDGTGQILWRSLRPVICSLIRGKKPPEVFKVDFCHYLSNGDVGSLRIQFERGELFLFTGYMQREFSMDKEAQQTWDENCRNFLKEYGDEVLSALD